MSLLTPDLRLALRSLWRRPLLFLVAAGVLALAIGASTAVFSVVDAVLLRPLPFREPDRLVMAWEREPESGVPFVEVSYPDYEDWRKESKTFTSMAILAGVNSGLTLHGEEPLRVQARLVSGNFFEVLGARPVLGRALTPEDDRPGAARVAVVSHGLWQRAFGGDPGLVGRSLMVDGGGVTVVGVMPRGLAYPQGAEMWIPLVPVIPQVITNRNVGWSVLVGRLATGVTLEQARAEADAIVGRLARTYHPTGRARAAVLTPFTEHFFGPTRRALVVLLGAVLLVLLVACANVSALLLARAGTRQRETAVRLALGASRGRLVRGLLAESSLIAATGGLGGALLAVWTLDLLVALVPAEVPRLALASVDARVLAFAVALSALTAVGAGLAPALLASRPSLTQALSEGVRTAGQASHHRLRALLLAAQAAVALVLLSGAGLLVQTFQNLRTVDLGYDPRRLLTLELSGPRETYAKPAVRRELYGSVVDRIGALPGVQAAAMVLLRPLWGQVGLDWPFRVEGQTEEDARRNPGLNLEVVTLDYFRTMRIPVLQGRTFDARDTEGAPVVAVVSRAMADRAWSGQDPTGKRLRMPLPRSPDYPQAWVTVIGVVGDARYRELQHARLDLYMSFLQSDEPLRHVVVRTAGDPLGLAGALKSTVRGLDPDLVVSEMATMESLVAGALGGARFGMQVLSAFALAGLLLAALGTYGVVAFLVGRRTREIGVRMALGARGRDVLTLVVGQGMAPVLAGLLAGLAGALALGRALARLLFGVPPHDPATLAGAAAVLTAAALLACTLPARRAARIDPSRALREE